MVNDYIKMSKNIPKVLNTVKSNKAEFIECHLHTPEILILNVNFGYK